MGFKNKMQSGLRRWIYSQILRGEVGRVILKNWGRRPQLRLLIDTSLRRHAVNVFTNQFMGEWSNFGPNPIFVGRREHTRKSLRPTEVFLDQEIGFLPVLGELARKGILHLSTSPELEWEMMRQRRGHPPFFGIDFLADTQIERVPRPVERTVVISAFMDNSGREAQIDFFRSIDDPTFAEIRAIFNSDTQIADAFHFWTAECAGLDGYLTMDEKFVNQYRSVFLRHGPKFKAKVYLPSELCAHLGAHPVNVDLLGMLIDPWKVGW